MLITNDEMKLTLQIRNIREKRGLTLAQLADMVGVSIPHLSEVERGKKNLNNHLLIRIAEALRVEPYELIQPDERGEVRQLLDLTRQLSDDDKKRIAAFARNLLSSKTTD